MIFYEIRNVYQLFIPKNEIRMLFFNCPKKNSINWTAEFTENQYANTLFSNKKDLLVVYRVSANGCIISFRLVSNSNKFAELNVNAE